MRANTVTQRQPSQRSRARLCRQGTDCVRAASQQPGRTTRRRLLRVPLRPMKHASWLRCAKEASSRARRVCSLPVSARLHVNTHSLDHAHPRHLSRHPGPHQTLLFPRRSGTCACRACWQAGGKAGCPAHSAHHNIPSCHRGAGNQAGHHHRPREGKAFPGCNMAARMLTEFCIVLCIIC